MSPLNTQNLIIQGNTFNIVSGNQTISTALCLTGPCNEPISGNPIRLIPYDAGRRDDNMQATIMAALDLKPPPQQRRLLGTKALPRLTTLFTGRADILKQMSHFFFFHPSRHHPSSTAVKTQKTFVLYGLGGAGKTAIMMKFVTDFSDQFSAVYYVDTSTLTTLQSGFEDIARCASAGQTTDDALQWLASARQGEEWLLLLDNADDPSIDLGRFLPPCTHGNVIITSRNPACRLHAPDSHCRVLGMDPDDATELLFKYAMVQRSHDNLRHCADIARELGYLALAIAQAGAYIGQSHCLSRYLHMYHTNRAELLRKHAVQSTDDYKWTAYTTWEMSLGQLTPAAATFLRVCSFMHHDRISAQIFRHAAAHRDAAFPNATRFLQILDDAPGWNEMRFLDCITELASYSLIHVHVNGDEYSIHPVVHAWARDRAEGHEYAEARTWAMEVLALSVQADGRRTTEACAFRRALLPHVDQIRTEKNLTAHAANQFDHVYRQCGRWKVAQELEEQVLETWKRELGDEHGDTLRMMNTLAITYSKQGRWKESETLGLRVSEAWTRLFGNDHPDTLNCKANLAMICHKQGRWKDAEAKHMEVLDARRRVLGDDHLSTISTQVDLAKTYIKQGRWKD